MPTLDDEAGPRRKHAQRPGNPAIVRKMSNGQYAVSGLIAALVSFFSLLFWMVNPVTAVFTWLGGLAAQAIGAKPPFNSA